VHEFGHLTDFNEMFKRFGIDINDTDYNDAIQRIEDISNGDIDGALNAGLITPEQHWLYEKYGELKTDLSTATTDAQKESIWDKFYSDITDKMITDSGIYSKEIGDLLRHLAGSKYAHAKDRNGDFLDNEARAEFYVTAREFPEMVQQAIDELNSQRIPNGERPHPDLDELMMGVFGIDITKPENNASVIDKPGVRRRIARAARTFRDPDRNGIPDRNIDDITDQVAEDYADQTFDNIVARGNRLRDNRRKNTVQSIFSAYSPDEIKKILAAIPQNQRTNNRFIQSLLTKPEIFNSSRTPAGGMSSREQDWLDLLSTANLNDWIDFTALTDAYVLGGGAGPLKTIDAVRKERKRVKLEKRNSRQAGTASNKLTKKITGSISNPRISKLSGSMGWVNTSSLPPWSNEPNAPKVENRVSAVLSPVENSEKALLQWGEDSFEIDTSIDPNELWKSEAFNEWATFHGNFAMRYVSAMLMGQDVPMSEGYGSETLDEGLKSIHDELVSGSMKGVDAAKQKRVRQEIEYAIAALRTLNLPENSKPYEIFRGLTGVPDDASILNLKKGDTFELPLSAFTASEDWAYEMGEFTENGQGVILKVLPGAHSTPTNAEYIQNPTETFDNYFEVVTAGRFELIEIDDVEGEQTVITLRQTDTFDPLTSKYSPVKRPKQKTSADKNPETDTEIDGATGFERPAPRREVSRLTGKIKTSVSSPVKYGLSEDKEVKKFDGFDHTAALESVNKIIREIETRHGKIKTVGDAAKALKTVFKKVRINHMGENHGPDGKSELGDRLTKSEQAAIAGILYTLNNSPHLKSRRLILSHEISDGSFSINGSTAIMPRIGQNGGPDFPEYGIRINIPFNENVAGAIIGEDMNSIDGVGNQVAKALLLHAQTLSPGQERDSYEQAALVSFFVGTSIHESIHALDMPQINDKIHKAAMQEDPSLQTERARIDHIFKQAGTRDEVLKTFVMRDAIDDVTSSNAMRAIGASMEYEANGPEEFLKNGRLSIDEVNKMKAEIEARRDEASSLLNDPLLDLGEQLQAMLIAQSMQSMIDNLDNTISQLTTLTDDLEENINNGTPEQSIMGTLHRSVYDRGLNYLSDVFPPGHPGYGTDVDLTVDPAGNMVALIDGDGNPVKELKATPEYMESTIISFIQAKDFHSASENAGFSLAGLKDLLDDANIERDTNGNESFSLTNQIQGIDPAQVDDLVDTLGQAYVAALSAEHWAPGIDDEAKWELIDWMRAISRYGSLTHFRYRNGLTTPSKQSIISAEINAELITSLILGAGAARTPMSSQVRGAIINILDWVYGGDSWKSILPDVSLEALKVK